MKRFSQTVVQIKNADGDFEPIAALRGMSSYECAVQNGFEGTEDDWLEMMIGDGWVGKFQELEKNKANKSDVYTSKQTDELLQGVMEDVEKLEENDARFTPLSSGLMSYYTSSTCFCFSPNKQYLACVKDGKLSLYRTADMSLVGEVSYLHDASFVRMDMDNDLIVVCYTATYGTYDTYIGNGKYEFYAYTNDWIKSTSVNTSLSGRLLPSSNFNAHDRARGNDDIFWFITEADTGNSSYSVKGVLNLLRKGSGVVQTFDLADYAIATNGVYGRIGILRDDDSVYVWGMQSRFDGQSNAAKIQKVVLYHYDSNGIPTELFNSTRNVGVGTASTALPIVTSIAVDIDSQMLIVSGSYYNLDSAYNTEYITVTYPFGGDLAAPTARASLYNSGDSFYCFTQGYGDTAIGIIGGKLYAGPCIYDPSTLDVIEESRYVHSFDTKFTAQSILPTTSMGLYYSIPIVGSLYLMSYSGYNTRPICVVAKELEFGGMLK